MLNIHCHCCQNWGLELLYFRQSHAGHCCISQLKPAVPCCSAFHPTFLCPAQEPAHLTRSSLPFPAVIPAGWVGVYPQHRHTHIPGLPKEARNSAQMMSSINTACFHPHGAQTLQTLNAKLPVSNTRMKMFKGHKAFCF